MYIQDYLRTPGKSLTTLTGEYKVDVKVHGQYPNLVLLKYNQIESDFNIPLVRECRGLILDRENDWKVISRSYDKFFNYGEERAATIDWHTAKICEKLDGSLATLYYYDKKWHVQTSGSPDASGDVNGLGFTFKELFWQTWEKLGYDLPIVADGDVCYMFELMTPFNRVVVPHKESRIVLHGMRSICTLGCCKPREFSPWLVKYNNYNWELVKTYSLGRSWEEIGKACEAINPMEQEGFVVMDSNFNRVKIKSPQYVALHHMKDGFGSRRMIELVRTNEGAEFLSYFPEFTDLYTEVKTKYDKLLTDVEEVFNQNKEIVDQKEYALKVKSHPWSGALFALKRGKTPDAKSYFKDVHPRYLVQYMKIKDFKVEV